MGDLTKNFSEWEFTCRHCGAYRLLPELPEELQKLRDFFDKPIQIISGYRCEEHPIEAAKKAIGRMPGFHAKGMAADIVIVGVSPEIVAAMLIGNPDRFRFRGVGLNALRGTVHVDVRKEQKIAKWSYDPNGRVIAYA